MNPNQLLTAVEAALASEWDRAHEIVQQDEQDALACWIHAVLHKMEGDAWNSRYWYARTFHHYEEWMNPLEELREIRSTLGTTTK